MVTHNLGKLERIDLRVAWKSESEDFTPWLAEQDNLDHLGDTLGMQLEFQASEQAVGPFSADLLCRDLADDSNVVIENQLNATDHDHLGKLLTYAANLNASTIVWVSKTFTDEHRAAIDWLNEVCADRTRFFGLEIELWRIGESAYAPKFNIVAKPNNWTKKARVHPADLSEVQRVQLEFWQGFYDYVSRQGQLINLTSSPRAQHYMAAGRIGRPRFLLYAIASTYSETAGWGGQELRAELLIKQGDLSAQYYEQLRSQQAEIEREMDEKLTWSAPSDSTACKIYVRQDVNLYALEERNEQYEWLLGRLESFHRVFASRIRDLKSPSGKPLEE